MRQHWTAFRRFRRRSVSALLCNSECASVSEWSAYWDWSSHSGTTDHYGYPIGGMPSGTPQSVAEDCLSFHKSPQGSTHSAHCTLPRASTAISSLVGLCLALPCLALPYLAECLQTWSAAAAGEAFSFSATLSRGETIGDVTSDPGLLRRPFRTASSGAVPAAGLKNSFIMTAEAEPVPAITA